MNSDKILTVQCLNRGSRLVGKTYAVEGDIEAARLALLRVLEEHPHMSQRDLSRALGISLGKTHYVLHALLDKGLVKIGNFRRSNNKLAYAYLLTPSGMREKMRLSRSFLARKEAEFRVLRQTIDSLRREIGKHSPQE